MIHDVCALPPKEEDLVERLEERLGRVYVQQRLRKEEDYEARLNGRRSFFQADHWYSAFANILKLTGVYARGASNAENIKLRHNHVTLADLPTEFEGFTILHLSDLHADMNPGAMERMTELIGQLEYDLCVLTGDFRGKACAV